MGVINQLITGETPPWYNMLHPFSITSGIIWFTVLAPYVELDPTESTQVSGAHDPLVGRLIAHGNSPKLISISQPVGLHPAYLFFV